MPGRWKAWIAPVGDLWSVVSLLLPTAAVAAIFEGLSRSYGVTHSQRHGLTVAPAFRILGGFLFAVFGKSIRSVKHARMKIAASLFGLFLVGLRRILQGRGWPGPDRSDHLRRVQPGEKSLAGVLQ
jgi:hypothetical protein